MVAILLVVILGMAAMAIDVSSWYFDQRHLQMQADAGVLAGANAYGKGMSDCPSEQSQIQQVASSYAGLGSQGIASNSEAGNVTGSIQVNCSQSYIDGSLSNSNPPSFFSGLFGIKPVLGAHARVTLFQVTQEGGFTVVPYAIEQSQAVFNNQLIQMVTNDGVNTQGTLACDGSSGSSVSGSPGAQLMSSLIASGCPVTQVNPGGTTCPATQLSPPSCLWEFNEVTQSDWTTANLSRLQNGDTSHSATCTNPYPIPTNNYAQYLSTGKLVPGDPRLITVFVVPDGSLEDGTKLIPILGYADFYLAGWKFDPCVGSSDPSAPGGTGNGGSIWGYFISMVNPESQDVQGTDPCDPNPSYAYTYNCTYALTQ